MNEIQAAQASKEELKWRKKHSCFSPGCKNVSFLRDWAGWGYATKKFNL